MWRYAVFLLAILLCAAPPPARATVFGSIRGIVHDPQHRPIVAADVKLHSATSDLSMSAHTNQDGEFTLNTVPIGEYVIEVSRPGFQTSKQNVTVISDASRFSTFRSNSLPSLKPPSSPQHPKRPPPKPPLPPLSSIANPSPLRLAPIAPTACK